MEATLTNVFAQTHAASAQIRRLTNSQKQQVLNLLADTLIEHTAQIMAANRQDLDLMDDANPMKDRLLLNEKRIENLAASVREIALLPDPTGRVLMERTLANGIKLSKVAVPLGVVGIIYESRPNVTIDVTTLCIRSGNAVVLRGGSDAWHSNSCLIGIVHKSLKAFGLSTHCVSLLPTDRALVKEMLTATRYIDIIIPRGSDRLIQFVRQHSLVPTIETGAGVVHTYIEQTADLEKAKSIVVNARVSRPSVCNSLDSILVDAQIADMFLPMLIPDFLKWNVEVFADEKSYSVFDAHNYPLLQNASASDFGREFLDYKIAVKVVSGIEETLEHLRRYSSRHTEAIISENELLCRQFVQEVDAAAVYVNASTRFTDGGEFGLGAEIGISTQKLHARGPFALEKLVTEKWIGIGNGQVRW